MKLKLEFEREELQLACEEPQKARNAEKALQDAQLAAQREARDLRLAELMEARELREVELKAKQEKALLEAKKEAAVREHELQMVGWLTFPSGES